MSAQQPLCFWPTKKRNNYDIFLKIGVRKIGGETAIYGRVPFWPSAEPLLVPLYTRVLTDQAAYGVVAEFMAYIAVLQVVLVMGLETGCFRYASFAEQKRHAQANKVFSTALSTVALVAGLFLAFVVFKTTDCQLAGLCQSHISIVYVGGILFWTASRHSLCTAALRA